MTVKSVKIFNLKLSFCILIFAFSICSFNANAQTDEERLVELRQQIEQLQKQADQYRSNIKGEQDKAASLKKEISVLQNQISRIQTQIQLTSKKIDKTSIEIGGIQTQIFNTQEKINMQKEAAGRLLLFLSRRDKEPLLATLLKNNSLSDFLKEGHYVNNISANLLDLVDELKSSKTVYEGQKNELEDKKGELESLKQEQSAQKSSLNNVTVTKSTLLARTKGQEAAYQKILANIEKQEMEFFKEQRELELKVISGGLYIVHITAETIPPKKTKIFQWPEEGYHITQGYGMTSYARRGAYGGAGHNGIDIAAGYGSPIKAISDGQIVANGTNDGWGNWVAIKHPNNMVSLYAHMSSLSFLKVGSNVKVGDVIGYEGATGHVTGSHLHLSIYRDFFTYLNDKKNGDLYFNYFEGSINPLDYL